jgi:hypothetical protein
VAQVSSHSHFRRLKLEGYLDCLIVTERMESARSSVKVSAAGIGNSSIYRGFLGARPDLGIYVEPQVTWSRLSSHALNNPRPLLHRRT